MIDNWEDLKSGRWEEEKTTKTAEKAEIVAEKAVNRLFGRDESNKNG